MNVSASELRRQFRKVVAEGWWSSLTAAAGILFPGGEFDAYDLFAIGSRETNWHPRYLEQPGDGGHGFGPMQIDDRSYPDWVATGKWRIPSEAIIKGAQVLRRKLEDVRALQGRPVKVTTKDDQVYQTVGRKLSKVEQQRVALAAYNSGTWAMYHASKGHDPDQGTTGGDYAADVLERAAVARGWAVAEPTMKTCPTCNGSGKVTA